MNKKILPLLTILLLSYCSVAQDTVTTYYDSDWIKTNKESAEYLGYMIKLGKKNYKIQDYWVNGELQMTGQCASKKGKKKFGEFITYFRTGTIKSVKNYRKGKLHGSIKSYYADGNLDLEGHYSNGVVNGTWNYYFENGQLCSKEVYSDGNLESVKQWNKKGVEEDNPKVEVEPKYPGGTSALMKFMVENIEYPAEAHKLGHHGTSYISFVINKEGKKEQIKVKKSSHPELDKEAMRVVGLMPDWKPGKQHNKPIRVRYTLPINFRLK